MALTDPTFVDERLAHWAAHEPDGEAMSYLGRTWTWAQWDERVRRVAGGLQALGIGRGDVVGFLDKNHPACVELSLGAASLGAANAIVNWRSAGDEVDYAVNDSGARVLVVGGELMPLVGVDPGPADRRREGHRGDARRRARATSTRPGWRPRSRCRAPRTSHPTTCAW